MSEENSGSKKIKVVDRRWFTEDGEVRPGRPRPTSSGSQGNAPEPGKAPAGSRAAAPPPKVEPEIGARETETATAPLFVELIDMLAQQAALMIKGAPGYPAQPAEAQRLIDYLGTLEQKTRGNLSVEEQQILSNLVFQLRSMYVQARK